MPELPFTLDQLRILKAIAAQGSFKKAADLLYVTQPAVSLQIQNLEKQYQHYRKAIGKKLQMKCLIAYGQDKRPTEQKNYQI